MGCILLRQVSLNVLLLKSVELAGNFLSLRARQSVDFLSETIDFTLKTGAKGIQSGFSLRLRLATTPCDICKRSVESRLNSAYVSRLNQSCLVNLSLQTALFFTYFALKLLPLLLKD